MTFLLFGIRRNFQCCGDVVLWSQQKPDDIGENGNSGEKDDGEARRFG